MSGEYYFMRLSISKTANKSKRAVKKKKKKKIGQFFFFVVVSRLQVTPPPPQQMICIKQISAYILRLIIVKQKYDNSSLEH